MSTSTEEVREQPPDPTEIVDTFRYAHESLLRDVVSAHSHPSDGILVLVAERMKACQINIVPFAEQLFFKEADNPLVMSMALGAVIDSANELAESIKTLNPYVSNLEVLKPNVQPYIARCISEDDGIEVDDEFITYIESGQYPTPEQATETACNTYLSLLEQLEETLMSTENVSEHIDASLAAKDKKDERRAMIRTGGLIAISAFAGTLLANKFSKKL